MAVNENNLMRRFHRIGGGKNRHLLFLFLLSALMILPAACGKKGPPLPPTHVEPPVVKGLRVTLNGDMATFQWPIPEWKGKNGNALAGFYVYCARLDMSESRCLECPLPFEKIAEIGITSSKPLIAYTQQLEKGFHYTYKVSVYTENGYEGETSAVVSIDY